MQVSRPGTRKDCLNCKHCYSWTLFTSCAAYPDGIPGTFVMGHEFHDKPHPGDNEIPYEGIPMPTIDELFADLEEREVRGEA